MHASNLTVYSVTSSARSSNGCGISSPSASAEIRRCLCEQIEVGTTRARGPQLMLSQAVAVD
jgi:hypothetical protein